MASFGELLGHFKANEDAENLVPIVDDDELRSGVVAWKSVQIRYKTPEDCPLKEEVAQWNWLWQHVEFDEQDFGIVAGVKGQNVSPLLRRMVGLRLIYPDGTINKLAKQYLQMQVLKEIKAPAPKQPRSPAANAPAGNPPQT